MIRVPRFSLAFILFWIGALSVTLGIIRLEFDIAATRQAANEYADMQELLHLQSWLGISMERLNLDFKGNMHRIYVSHSVSFRCDVPGIAQPIVLLEIPPGEHVVSILVIHGDDGLPAIQVTRFTNGIEADTNTCSLPIDSPIRSTTLQRVHYIAYSGRDNNNFEICRFHTDLGNVKMYAAWCNGSPFNPVDYCQQEISSLVHELGRL